MLDKMGYALLRTLLVARADADVDTNMGDDGLSGAEYDADAVGKSVVVVQLRIENWKIRIRYYYYHLKYEDLTGQSP